MLPLNFLEYALKGALFFNGGGSSFLSGRVSHGGASALIRGLLKKIMGWGGIPLWNPPPVPPSHYAQVEIKKVDNIRENLPCKNKCKCLSVI